MSESPLLTAGLLGVVQGATEFLPVSSDGHLAAFALLWGASPMSLALAVVLHTGTLVATVIVLRSDLVRLASACVRGMRDPRHFAGTAEGGLLLVLFVACIPTAIIGLALEGIAAEANRHALVVGAGFLVSAGAALLTRGPAPTGHRLSLRAAALLGAVQAIAVLPGVSRSGSTIACAMALGLAPGEAFRLSFLLSVPAVAGAVLLELRSAEARAAATPAAWFGAAVAGIVGYACLRLLRRLLALGHFWRFSWYLIPLGFGMMLWGLFSAAGG